MNKIHSIAIIKTVGLTDKPVYGVETGCGLTFRNEMMVSTSKNQVTCGNCKRHSKALMLRYR